GKSTHVDADGDRGKAVVYTVHDDEDALAVGNCERPHVDPVGGGVDRDPVGSKGGRDRGDAVVGTLDHHEHLLAGGENVSGYVDPVRHGVDRNSGGSSDADRYRADAVVGA